MKQKNSVICLMLLLGGLFEVYAQEVVSAVGDATGSGGSSNYTVGQLVYTTSTGTNGSVTPGVQHSYVVSTTFVLDAPAMNLKLVAYPNPTKDALRLNVGNYNSEKLTYQLHDLRGTQLENKKLLDSSMMVDVKDLPSDTYLLSLFHNNTLIKTFKIVKN